MGPTVLLVVAVGAMAAAALLAVAAAAVTTSAGDKMIKALTAFEQIRSGTYVAPRDRSLFARLGAPLAGHFTVAGRVITTPSMRRRLVRLLDYAGNPPAWPIERVMRYRAGGVLGGAAAGVFFGGSYLGEKGMWLGGVLGAIGGMFLPDLLVYNAGVKRQEQLLRGLPDILDMLVIGVEAGLSLEAAMAQIASHTDGPLAGEVHRVLQEMRIGKSRSEAMRALAARTTVQELRTFVTAVVQAGELGVPVGGVLRENAVEMRTKRRQRAEELAQKVPVKILFPVLFCLFPATFVVVLGPSVPGMLNSF